MLESWVELRDGFGVEPPSFEVSDVFPETHGHTFLSLSLLPSKHTNFLPLFERFLKKQTKMTEEGISKFRCRIQSLNELRESILKPERSVDGITLMFWYYLQLDHLQHKLTIDKKDKVDFKFVWYECFKPKEKIPKSCVLVEKACVIFNVAAIFSQIAAHQNDSFEGIKTSCECFQKAAGCLVHIRDRLGARFEKDLPKTSCLHQHSLTVLSEVMLAQAQECHFRLVLLSRFQQQKHNHNPFSNSKTEQMWLCSMAMQSSRMYQMALEGSTPISCYIETRHRFISQAQRALPKDWVAHLQLSTSIFLSLAHYLMSPCLEGRSILGERIQRLTSSVGFLNSAMEMATPILVQKKNSTMIEKSILLRARDQLHLFQQQLKHAEQINEQLHFAELLPPESVMTPIPNIMSTSSSMNSLASINTSCSTIGSSFSSISTTSSSSSSSGNGGQTVAVIHLNDVIASLEFTEEYLFGDIVSVKSQQGTIKEEQSKWR
eukprot:Lithocolla_globosa_v1_NODE_3628_length_1621_cov_2.709451.p1 type:complete len:490 gc:universal NODE_3628_length_1621_cov_2.709451:1497-28(-)